MRPALRLAAFTGILALAGGAAFGVGSAWFDSDPVVRHDAHPSPPAMTHGGHGSTVLRQLSPAVTRGSQEFRFALERDGERITDYDVRHERELHLIVVRHDLTGFRHVHPTRGSDGSWSVPLTFDAPGPYRVYADFAEAGEAPQAVVHDVTVPGDYDAREVSGPERRTAPAGADRVQVTGDLEPGREAVLAFSVTDAGRPVTDLEPYLGAQAHLVLLRADDLSYLHVHPEGDELAFATTVPGAGSYAAFLETKRDGVVRTSALMLRAE